MSIFFMFAETFDEWKKQKALNIAMYHSSFNSLFV